MPQRPVGQFLHERSTAQLRTVVDRRERRGERHALEHVSDGKRRLLLFNLHLDADQTGVGAPKHVPATTPCPAANAAADMRLPLAGCTSRSRKHAWPQATSMPSLPVASDGAGRGVASGAIGSARHTLTSGRK